ncbi:PAAR domain-containing protein [Burkholderia sp. FERM BP-3421]|uniref:PAAR domain-containing protein n=1 Tax=Burkholderia sp. FERM BP-3421 TaxID=1494466 RepID=UPI002363077B|nr:PAAR domain-containing protein [Burkholderia sp. FERM BP-3421]WDD93500.1 PAAR domain-containing protein [Burkholderia sp. FERM BP-3421]
MRSIICQGDTTSHGGRVLEGSESYTLYGRRVSGVGHMVLCPQCKGVFPILPDTLGRRVPHQIAGRDTAVEGMRTACGATLIAQDANGTLDDVGAGTPTAGVAAATSAPPAPSSTLCLECLQAAARDALTIVPRG